KRALSYEGDGPRAAQMRYYYGVALGKLGDYQESASQLEQSLAGGAEKTVGADARYHLGFALEMLQKLDRARLEYMKFVDAHPHDPLFWPAKQRAADIAQRQRPQ